jgi:1-acyl-sn-glycerol-3-phosphate acyltransferase
MEKNAKISLGRFPFILTLNLWFYFWAPFVLFASLLIYIPFVTFTRVFFPAKAMRCFRRCINLYGKSVAMTAWPWIRVRVSGIPSREGAPYVFVENHTSSFDPFVQGFLPFELVQAARGWALRLPVLGFFAKWAGYIDVDSMSSEIILDHSAKLLESGVSIVFFPEGTRRSPDEGLGPFHGTSFRVACAASATVVPVVVKGISDKPRKGSLVMNPGLIEIVCLPPVKSDPNSENPHFEMKKRVRASIEAALLEKLEKNNCE